MPHLTPETRERRQARILDAARDLFTSNGFHATSMDDIVAAAGVSAGGVYRHFPHKKAIVAAIAAQVVGDLGAQVTGRLEALPGPRPLDLVTVVSAALGAVDEVADGPGRLALQVWGEAQRDPEIAQVASTGLAAVRAVVAAHLQPSENLDSLVPVVFALMSGYLVQRCVIGDVDPESFAGSLSAFAAEI